MSALFHHSPLTGDYLFDPDSSAPDSPIKAASEALSQAVLEGRMHPGHPPASDVVAVAKACERNYDPFNGKDWAMWSLLTFTPPIVLWPGIAGFVKLIRWIRDGFAQSPK